MTLSNYPISAQAWDATNTPCAHLCVNRLYYHRMGRMEAFRFEIAHWIERDDVVRGAYLMRREIAPDRSYFMIGFQCEDAALAFKMRWSGIETALVPSKKDLEYLR